MNFNSLPFLIFFVFVYFIYWKISEKFRNLVLLLSSYVFYSFWSWKFAFLLAFLTVSNYFLGRQLDRAQNAKQRKNIVALTIVQNLAILGFFKYLGFFQSNLVSALGKLDINVDFPTISLVLPLGISFFIFQTTSYIIDVYRGKVPACNSLVNFGAFVAYFPHMAAGPIMPARILLPQIALVKRKLDSEAKLHALLLIASGLFRKIVIADTIAPSVNRIFGAPDTYGWKSMTLATIGFGLQIYGDFSGYSSIARGVSKLLSIDMILNFKQPYFASSITEFWRRWHISLSTWFRDYLYIPLGGNRRKFERTLLNLFIVMVLAGMWHGAAWGFLIWGAIHGVLLVLDKVTTRVFAQSKFLTSRAGKASGWFLTMTSVFIAWIFFRNPNFHEASTVLRKIVTLSNGSLETSDILLIPSMLVMTVLIDLGELLLQRRNRYQPFLYSFLAGIMLLVALTFRSSEVTPFIYFRF